MKMKDVFRQAAELVNKHSFSCIALEHVASKNENRGYVHRYPSLEQALYSNIFEIDPSHVRYGGCGIVEHQEARMLALLFMAEIVGEL